MMSNASQYVAVDVSKAMLDIAMPGANRVWRSSNTTAGIAAFRERLKRFDRPHVVCEATGRYGRLLAQQMGTAGIAMSIVNPRQVRDFGLWPKFILSACKAAEGPERPASSPKPMRLTRASSCASLTR